MSVQRGRAAQLLCSACLPPPQPHLGLLFCQLLEDLLLPSHEALMALFLGLFQL